MKKFKQYIQETSRYARAVASFHSNEPQYTVNGITARTNRDPQNITADERRALLAAIETARQNPKYSNLSAVELSVVVAHELSVPVATILYVMKLAK